MKYLAKNIIPLATICFAAWLAYIGKSYVAWAITGRTLGFLIKTPQDSRYSTFEPSTDIKDIYRPDLLMLNAAFNQ